MGKETNESIKNKTTKTKPERGIGGMGQAESVGNNKKIKHTICCSQIDGLSTIT